MTTAEMQELAIALSTACGGVGGILAIARGWLNDMQTRQDAKVDALTAQLEKSNADCNAANISLAEKHDDCERRHDELAARFAEANLLNARELSDTRVEIAQLRAEVRRKVSPAYPMPAVRPKPGEKE